MSKPKLKCFAYLRVSDVSNTLGDGFPRQEKAVRDYVKAHNLEIVHVYKERWTGTSENRPVLAELMITLEKNGHGVNTVIVEKLDRLARDYFVQEAIIRDFKKQGFELISALEGADLLEADPTRKLIRQMFGIIAEYEKSMIVAKLKAARDRISAKAGKCEGRKGYRDKEGWQEVLNHIEELRQRDENGKRKTLQEVADILNTEGIKTLTGLDWNIPRVHQTERSIIIRKRT
jgi:DNA invertase Pin-like site-specific DNA recombinase